MLNPNILLGLSGLGYLLAAGVQPAPRPLHPPDNGAADAALVTDDRTVNLAQLQCVRDSFATYFKAGSSASSLKAIAPAAVDVDWSSLRSKVEEVRVEQDTLRAVRIHYGLAAPSSSQDHPFSLGIEVVRIRFISGVEWEVIPLEDAFYTVDATGSLKPASLGSWTDDDAYFAHAYVRRASNSTTFVQVDTTSDTRSILFPWENELVDLHDQNSGCDAIRFVCIAEPSERNGSIDLDMRHHLCCVALASGTELVNNSAVVPTAPFQNKACDIGCPCPATCDNAAFPVHGMPVRNCP